MFGSIAPRKRERPLPAGSRQHEAGYVLLVARLIARLILLVAPAVWLWGVILVIGGNAERGVTIGLPAAVVLLAFAWRRTGFWLPDGGGGP
jgi:hypothetical protein